MKQLLLSLFIIALSGPLIAKKSFMLGGYIPYWRSSNAMNTAKKYTHLFDQISPFSYEVDAQGNIKDPFKHKHLHWREFYHHFKKHNALFVPTIYWTDTRDMHNVFSAKKSRDGHLKQIMDIVIKNSFDGININYERVGGLDRHGYLTFLEELSQELHKRGLVLYISIGGRTGDNTIGVLHPRDRVKQKDEWVIKKKSYSSLDKQPKRTHVSLNPGKGEDAARYKRIFSQCCDQVIIMGYDEWGRPYKWSKEARKNNYYFSHSSTQWIEQIIEYGLTFIPKHKLVLGLPTYGLEFAIFPQPNDDFKFKKRRNLNYTQAQEVAHAHRKEPQRTAGGELCYTYKNHHELRYVCFLDKKAYLDRIAIAKKYGIKGVYLFTVNGSEDTEMWKLIEKELFAP